MCTVLLVGIPALFMLMAVTYGIMSSINGDIENRQINSMDAKYWAARTKSRGGV